MPPPASRRHPAGCSLAPGSPAAARHRYHAHSPGFQLSLARLLFHFPRFVVIRPPPLNKPSTLYPSSLYYVPRHFCFPTHRAVVSIKLLRCIPGFLLSWLLYYHTALASSFPWPHFKHNCYMLPVAPPQAIKPCHHYHISVVSFIVLPRLINKPTPPATTTRLRYPPSPCSCLHLLPCPFLLIPNAL